MNGYDPDLRIEVSTSIDDLDSCAEHWTELESRTPEATGFQSYAWCRAWLTARQRAGLASELRVTSLWHKRRLVMLWPLAIERLMGVRIATWIGTPMTQYGDVLAESGTDRIVWQRASEAFFAQWRDVDLFQFTRVRADAALSLSGSLGKAMVGGHELAPYVPFEAHRAPQCADDLGKSSKRRARKLAAQGPVHVEAARDRAARLHAIGLALHWKRQWLAQKGFFSAGLSHPATAAFLAELADADSERFWAFCLFVGDDIAAVEIGLVTGTTYRSVVGSYDPRFAQGSPGQALIGEVLRQCRNSGLTAYDFMAPADPYKTRWTDEAVPIASHFVPRTMLGTAAAFGLARLRPLAKKAVAKVPAWGRLIVQSTFGPSDARLASPLQNRDDGLLGHIPRRPLEKMVHACFAQPVPVHHQTAVGGIDRLRPMRDDHTREAQALNGR